MFIAWLEPPSATVQGDQIYRTIQPVTALAQEPGVYTLAGSWLHPQMHEAAAQADVLVLCQAVDADFLPLLAQRNRAGRITCMEINDNFLHPHALGGAGAFYQQPAQRALAMQLAREATGLLLSTPYLEELFGHLNSHRLVLPNSLTVLPPLRQKAASHQTAPLRLGWAGSAGHLEDLQAVMPSLKQIVVSHPEVVLCIMGSESLHPLFAWLPRGRLELRPAGSLADYQRFLATLDVGLAPLRDTPFNRGRSDVKHLEYAAAGVATVFSAGPAYADVIDGVTGLKAKTLGDFVAQVDKLIASPALRQTLAEAAYSSVKATRLLGTAAARLRNFLTELPGPGGKPRALHAPTEAAAAWRRSCGHAPRQKLGPRAAYLSYTPLQQHLIVGLGAKASDAVGQAAHLSAAARLDANFYLPLLYAGSQNDAAKGHPLLAQARALQPNSVAVALQQMRLHLATGDAEAALRAAPKRLPDGLAHAPVLCLEAQVLARMGDRTGQVRALRSALAQVPWYRDSALQLATLALEGQAPMPASEPSLDEAQAALSQPAAMVPASWGEAFMLGRVLRAQGALAAARTALEQADAAAQAARHAEGARMCAAHLAEVCLRLGDGPAAMAYLHTAQTAKPH